MGADTFHFELIPDYLNPFNPYECLTGSENSIQRSFRWMFSF